MREYDLIAVLEGRHPFAPAPNLQMPELQTIIQNGLTAVLSAIPRPPLRPAPSVAQQLQNGARQLALQTACMDMAPLLPVRLDTAVTLAGAKRLLMANQPFLDQLLTRYAGLAQVQIMASWQDAGLPTRFANEAARTDPRAQSLPWSPDSTAATRTSAKQQVSRQISSMISARLATVVTQIAPLALTPGLVWSGIVLVPLQRLRDLTRALDQVSALWPEGLQIRQIGPDPVTAFATIDVVQVTATQIETALKAFWLHPAADHGQLAAARRRRLDEASRLHNPALRAAISHQAEILTAAARLNLPNHGFALCRIRTDHNTRVQPPDRAVA